LTYRQRGAARLSSLLTRKPRADVVPWTIASPLPPFARHYHQENIMVTQSNLPDSGNAQIVGTAGLSSVEKSSRISRDLQNLSDDVANLVTHTGTLAREDLRRIKTTLSDRVAAARKSLGATGDEIAHRARHTATVTNNYVHEQPWKAVGIGAAVGVLLGVLFARRK
jgi:ElaB/YqjD/DUF883 family membrane-anchored ribosome-binding protein